MKKAQTHYSCQNCGYSSTKWLGRCPSCESWNSLVEERDVDDASLASARQAAVELAGGLGKGTGRGAQSSARGLQAPSWVPLESAPGEEGGEISAPQQRLRTGMAELDRVLGGGLVPDSFVLLGGDPGIGKSTLLLQMAKGIRQEYPDFRMLYVSGEESVEQIRGRAHRLGVQGGNSVFLAAETQIEKVFAILKEVRPQLLLMDSLQTFASSALESAPGSVSQVREIALRLMALAKSAGICVWLVGHVTKEGNIAGPKTVEHMVDTVLYFESEGGQAFRLLRAVKNRFGSSRELGVFEMDGEGLKEVSNPSSLFLSEREEPVPGTAVGAALEGSRPLLVELQALVAASELAVPRRTSVGMDHTRVSLISAILERHMRLSMAKLDLFFNVAGGLRLTEPACDLAAAAAIWSSHEERAIPTGWVFIGELGLTGEVRRVSQIDVRVEEAAKLGFKTLVVPANAMESLKKRLAKGVRLIPIGKVSELPKIAQNFSHSDR